MNIGTLRSIISIPRKWYARKKFTERDFSLLVLRILESGEEMDGYTIGNKVREHNLDLLKETDPSVYSILWKLERNQKITSRKVWTEKIKMERKVYSLVGTSSAVPSDEQ